MSEFWFSYDESTGNLMIGHSGEPISKTTVRKPLSEWYRLTLPPEKPCDSCGGTGSADTYLGALVECDCSSADRCPQGKTGAHARCTIWVRKRPAAGECSVCGREWEKDVTIICDRNPCPAHGMTWRSYGR